jgi:uncharacterized membrane protein YgcG
MKTVALILTCITVILVGCKSHQKMTSINNDDVYYNPSNQNQLYSQESKYSRQQSSTPISPQFITSPDSTASLATPSVKSDETYSENDYTARIKRFHNSNEGNGYFDDPYLYNETDPNVSVSVGSAWGPYCAPSFSVGWNWGCSSWGWNWGYPYWWWYWDYPYYWYYPYSYWGYGGYWYGYWDGYWRGYYDGYYGYPYYPPYWEYPYSNYSFYGSRRLLTTTGNNAPERNQRELNTTLTTTGKRESPPIASSRISQDQQQCRYQRQVNDHSQISQRSSINYTQEKQQPSPRYSKPNLGSSVQRTSQNQNYAPPTYRQAKSSQEYINPRSQNPVSSGQVNKRSNESKTIAPTNNNKTKYIQPSNENRPRQYTTPQRSNSSYSAPSRSTQRYSPQRSSSNTYSAPSRSSGGTYSTPSRSGGGSSGSSGKSSHSGGSGSRTR